MSNIRFNLKFDGEYEKYKVANKIIIATNQYLNDGYKLNAYTWGVKWNSLNKNFTKDGSYKWGMIISSILMYSDYLIDKPEKPKTEIIADILGVNYSWIQGFLNKLDGRYESIVKSLCKRKSIKGQQCRDGMEIGSLLRIGYLANRSIITSSYSPCEKEKFNSHNWDDIAENKILLSLGVIQGNKISQCTKCQIFGSFVVNLFKPEGGYYVSTNLVDDRFWYRPESYNYSCDEIIIKNILE